MTDDLPAAGREPLDAAALSPTLTSVGAGRVHVVATTGSTSTDLVAAVAADPQGWPDRSVLVADHQQAGRGRAGRVWSTPARAALTVSVLLRPQVPVERFAWVPLLTGLAVVQAVGDVAGVGATLKWPNDVLTPTEGTGTVAADGSAAVVPGWGRRRKVAGILAELVATPTGPAVVVGIGVNVSQDRTELPVPSATSLRLAAGRAVDRAGLLTALMARLVSLDRRWRSAAGVSAELAAECAAVCSTLGETVRVELPGGEVLHGTARRLADDGALEVVDAAGLTRTVLAGDVHHLRTGPVN